MNYIHHLNSFYAHLDKDLRIKPFHISLYMALFQSWKHHKFAPSFVVGRKRLMQTSRIGSKTTFAKLMNELFDFGLIRYYPPMVTMVVLPSGPVWQMDYPDHQMDHPDQQMDLLDTKTGPQAVPQVGHIDKQSNRENKRENLSLSPNDENKGKKMIPPSLEEVTNWFTKNNGTAEVANIFFENYNSNGWEMADGPMKNWKSAAIKWIFNTKNTLGNGKSNYLHTDNHKNYGEPL